MPALWSPDGHWLAGWAEPAPPPRIVVYSLESRQYRELTTVLDCPLVP